LAAALLGEVMLFNTIIVRHGVNGASPSKSGTSGKSATGSVGNS
jgi:hypothetical protein